jgi:hypothetical protein
LRDAKKNAPAFLAGPSFHAFQSNPVFAGLPIEEGRHGGASGKEFQTSVRVYFV